MVKEFNVFNFQCRGQRSNFTDSEPYANDTGLSKHTVIFHETFLGWQP